MGWVTLDDGQHVLIGPSGRVLATRAQISSASGGKERGQALAGRSKAAVLARIATQKTKSTPRLSRVASSAKAAGRGTPERAAMAKYYREDRANTVAAKAALAKATATTHNPVTTQGVELTGKPGNAPHIAAGKFNVPTELKVPETVRAAALAKSNATMREQARAAGWVNRKTEPTLTPKQHASQVAAFEKGKSGPGQTMGWGFGKAQSPATTRAVEHAKAAGRGTPERAEVARQAKIFRNQQILSGKAGKPANDIVRQVIAKNVPSASTRAQI